jgi:hypothetical protein
VFHATFIKLWSWFVYPVLQRYEEDLQNLKAIHPELGAEAAAIITPWQSQPRTSANSTNAGASTSAASDEASSQVEASSQGAAAGDSPSSTDACSAMRKLLLRQLAASEAPLREDGGLLSSISDTQAQSVLDNDQGVLRKRWAIFCSNDALLLQMPVILGLWRVLLAVQSCCSKSTPNPICCPLSLQLLPQW